MRPADALAMLNQAASTREQIFDKLRFVSTKDELDNLLSALTQVMEQQLTAGEALGFAIEASAEVRQAVSELQPALFPQTKSYDLGAPCQAPQ